MQPNEIQFVRNLDALKSPQCRRIIQSLYLKPRTLAELVQQCKLTPGSIKQHLALLASAGLILASIDEGEETYALQMDTFSETQEWFKNLGR